MYSLRAPVFPVLFLSGNRLILFLDKKDPYHTILQWNIFLRYRAKIRESQWAGSAVEVRFGPFSSKKKDHVWETVSPSAGAATWSL